MMILRITMTKLPDKRKFSSIRSVYPVQLCTVPLFVFLYLISSYIALRAGLSTQSSCAPRILKDGGDDQRESQVKLLLQRQIHRHKKTNTQTQKDKYTKTLVMIKEALILIQVALRYDMMASKIAHSLAIVK